MGEEHESKKKEETAKVDGYVGEEHESKKKEETAKVDGYVHVSDQPGNKYICGSCVMGFTDLEDYRAHCDEEQHNYHITRRIELLVPGIGFCPACSCLIQTPRGWEHHLTGTKHVKCVESLNAIGIDGNYEKPLGCVVPGELGAPISFTEISQAVAKNHGAGNGGRHGGRPGGLVIPNAPLMGLNEVTLSNKDDKSDQPKYHCGICDFNFTYKHRSTHMLGIEHRVKYFEERYPDYHKEISDLNNAKETNNPNQLAYRIMFLAHKVEELEKENETEFAKELRVKWKTEATKNGPRSGNIRPNRGIRGSYRGGSGWFRGGHAGYVPFHGPPPGHPHFRGPRGFPGNYGPGGYLPGPRYLFSTLPRGRGGPPRHFQEYVTLGKRGSGDYPPHSYKRPKHDPYAEAGDINQLQDDDWESSMDPYEAVDDDDEYGRAMEAIQVLENYTAKHSIKSRIDGVKRAMIGGSRGGPRMSMMSKSDISALADPYSTMGGGPGPSSLYRGRGGPGRFRGGPGPRMGPPFRGGRYGPRF